MSILLCFQFIIKTICTATFKPFCCKTSKKIQQNKKICFNFVKLQFVQFLKYWNHAKLRLEESSVWLC